jgi:ABC-type taurine transport system substrate-binding protein/outer membrane protein OmpA-like peptidoglycan-associated protein
MNLPKFILVLATAASIITNGNAPAKPVNYVTPAKPFADSTAFSTHVGEVSGGPITIPIITWAADGVTVAANNGMAQSSDSSLAKALGHPVSLALKDDFEEQIRDYISGKTPFLRGTVGMIDLASEALANKDPKLAPVVIMQISWSTGADGFVAKNIKTLSDLKGKTIVVQQNGPHVDLVQVLLQDAGLQPGDVTIKYVKDISFNAKSGNDAANDPANALRSDPSLTGASAIEPDILALTAGGKVGTGAEDSVKGATPILTTRTANRVIADVYAVRQDYFDSHPDEVKAFVKAMLDEQATFKAYTDNISLKGGSDAGKTAEFKKLCKPLAGIFEGDEAAINDYILWVGVDSELAQVAGNISFFTEKNNPVGFSATQARIHAYYQTIGLVSGPHALATAQWDWTDFTGHHAAAKAVPKPTFTSESAVREAETGSDARTLFTYTFKFPAKMSELKWTDYPDVFDTIHEKVTRYGGAVVQLRGHADNFFYNFVQMKMARGDKTYQRRNPDTGQFETLPLPGIDELTNAANQLSISRAVAIKQAYAQYLREKVGLSTAEIDLSRFDVKGMGVGDPVYPNATTPEQREANMRGELVIIGVESELPIPFPPPGPRAAHLRRSPRRPRRDRCRPGHGHGHHRHLRQLRQHGRAEDRRGQGGLQGVARQDAGELYLEPDQLR